MKIGQMVNSGGGTNDFLIIAPSIFKKPLLDLVRHKLEHDIKSRIVTLDEIYHEHFFPVRGKDQPERIKYFIKNAIEDWGIRYVLLVGGAKQLPVRYVHNFAEYPSSGILEPPYISDLYYADIYDPSGEFSSWDTNSDGVYGEWKGAEAEDKDIDLRPDVLVGRIPCQNRFEVSNMVHKIIHYERETYGAPWFKNMVVAGGDTHPQLKTGYAGELEAQEALEYMKGFTPVKFFASNQDLTQKGVGNMIKAINSGCGFLYLAGHGNPPFWATHPPHDERWVGKFSIHHMALLTNRDRLPICIVNGCRNSAFDTHPVNLLRHPLQSFYWMDCIPKCWAWALTSKIAGGSIAAFGSTGLGHIKWDPETGGKADAWSFLSPQFFWEYGMNKTDVLGEIWGNIIHRYLKKFPIDWHTPSLIYPSKGPKPDVINVRTVQQFMLFGDPTLKIGGYP